MKPFYLCTLIIATSIAASAQVAGGLSYSLSYPLHEMQQNIRPAHSLSVIATSRFKKLSKLSWGIEAGIGSYAFFTKHQELRFPDGTGISTDVSYSSNIITAGMLSRLYFFKQAKVNPFLSGKLGYANFFSNVTVAAPEDPDDCKPLDKNTPIHDHSFFAAYGAGLHIDVSRKKKSHDTWLEISANQLHGTKLSYINVKDIKNHIHNDPGNPVSASDKSVPLSIRFVNVTTQTIHEHQLAEVYTSALRLLEFKIGILWRLGN